MENWRSASHLKVRREPRIRSFTDYPTHVLCSLSGPMHSLAPRPAVIGDTTSTRLLLFTPPFANLSSSPPVLTYPNYTLPPPPFDPPPPSSPPAHTLFVVPTDTTALSPDPLAHSLCSIRKRWAAGGLMDLQSESSVKLAPADMGWREMIVASGVGLSAGGNFTAWVLKSDAGTSGVSAGGQLSGPVMFKMKEGSSMPFKTRHSSLVADLAYLLFNSSQRTFRALLFTPSPSVPPLAMRPPSTIPPPSAFSPLCPLVFPLLSPESSTRSPSRSEPSRAGESSTPPYLRVKIATRPIGSGLAG